MIMNNENKKLSPTRKRRIDRKIKMDDKMKSLLNQIKSERKRKTKILMKLKKQKLNQLKLNTLTNLIIQKML